MLELVLENQIKILLALAILQTDRGMADALKEAADLAAAQLAVWRRRR